VGDQFSQLKLTSVKLLSQVKNLKTIFIIVLFDMKKVAALLIIVSFVVSSIITSELVSLSSANPVPQGGVPSIRHGFIRSNGDVDPSRLPIQRNGNSYVLTNNIVNYTLEIQRSSILLDGAGFTIQGVYAYRYDGLTLSHVSDVTVKNLKLNIFNYGIVLNNTSNIKVINNRVDAEFCIILANVSGSEVYSNTLFGKGYCMRGQCTNCLINYNYLDGEGIHLSFSDYNNITNNLFKQHPSESIELGRCYHNIISGNTLFIDDPSDVPSGIAVSDESAYNAVFRNNIIGCYSIFIVSSVIISNAHDNVFYENNFANSQYGVYVDGYGAIPSVNNKFFSNNFLNISKPVQINNNASVNNWDNGSIGNYWSDYLTKYPQAKAIDNTATGDTPYNLNAHDTDNYPLISQVNIEFSATLPSPIAPPTTITINDPTTNPTPSLPISTSGPEPTTPINTDGSPTATPIIDSNPDLTSDFWSSQTFVIALLTIVSLMIVILPIAFYFKKLKL
jgi:parallel beta-helix repeat protein